jgi:hypothetical protein
VETTLRNTYIREGHGAAKRVGDEPGPLHTGHTSGVRSVRCLEIPARPVREAHKRRRATAPEVVFLREEVERPPRMANGLG